MMALQLVAAVADDQRDRFAARGADQERQERTCGTIGPLEVLDNEDQRSPAGCGGQHGHQCSNKRSCDPAPTAMSTTRSLERVPSPNNSASSSRSGATSAPKLAIVHPTRQRAQRTHDRRIRELPLTERQAFAYGDAHLLTFGLPGDFRYQTSLPHARFSGEKDHRPDALAGSRERRFHRRQLRWPPHEPRT